MTIPVGYGQGTVFFGGAASPLGAAVTFGFRNDTGFSASSCASLIVNSWTSSTIMANLSSSCATTKVRAKLGPDNIGPFAEQAMSIGGSGAATVVSPNVSFLCRKFTDMGGRQGRGRFYLPGPVEADVDAAGLVAPAAVTNLNTDLAAFLVAMDAADVPLYLLHDDLLAPTRIIGLTCDTKVATQRRRLRR